MALCAPRLQWRHGEGRKPCRFLLAPAFPFTRKRPLFCPVRGAGSGGEETPQPNQSHYYGLGGPGTCFGFGKHEERQVGRLAMVGFASGVVMEVFTGKGVLGQVGIDAATVRYPFLAGFAFLVVGGLLGGYVLKNNPPDPSKAPPNHGAGLPRDPLKTFDPQTIDRLTTWTRGGIVNRPSGQKGREPYVSELDLPRPPTEEE